MLQLASVECRDEGDSIALRHCRLQLPAATTDGAGGGVRSSVQGLLLSLARRRRRCS